MQPRPVWIDREKAERLAKLSVQDPILYAIERRREANEINDVKVGCRLYYSRSCTHVPSFNILFVRESEGREVVLYPLWICAANVITVARAHESYHSFLPNREKCWRAKNNRLVLSSRGRLARRKSPRDGRQRVGWPVAHAALALGLLLLLAPSCTKGRALGLA